MFSIKERDRTHYNKRKRLVDREKEIKRDTLVQYDSIQSKQINKIYYVYSLRIVLIFIIIGPIPQYKSNSMNPKDSQKYPSFSK